VGLWLGAFVAVLLGWIFSIHFFGEGLTNLSYDLPLLYKRIAPPEDILIVFQDSESGEKLGQDPDATWDRKLLAQLLRRLKEDGSRTVVLDLVFNKPSRVPGDDAVLATALRAHGKVVLSDNRLLPILATNAAAVGVERVFPDGDNVVRKLFSGRTDSQGREEVAFTWRAAELEGAPITRRAGERDRFRFLNYYGPPGTISSVSFYDAISNTPPGFFSGKLVLIGAPSEIGAVGAGKDTFNSPYKGGGKTLFAGVEVHATILANLVHSEWLNGSLPLQALTLTIFGLVIGLALVRFRPLLATVIAIGAAFAVFVVACLASWYLHFWFPWFTMVTLQIPAALGWAVLYHWVQSQLQNQFLEQSMSMYLSPKLVKKFSRDKDRSVLKPGAEKMKLTILFSDIAGFTSVSEGMDSDELARMMNEYFENAVGKCIHPTDGTVVKYIGDAIFAFWNAPEPQPDHAVRACDAALLFREMSAMEVRGKKLVTRIGLHTGVANVGNFGSSTRVDYTALGEDINLAARMEGLNKYLGTTVLMTGAVRKEISERFVTRYLGRFQLKGFEHSVDVHELLAESEESDAVLLRRKDFASAVELFQKRDFVRAQAVFRRLHDEQPEDVTTQFYLKHLSEMRFPLPEGWNGEVELKEK
jgi:adenylate cyclase